MFSQSAMNLNRIDVSDCIYSKNKDFISNIFILVGIKYVSGKKYYMIAPIYYNYDDNNASNFTSSNLEKILLSKRAIDVTINEYQDLCKKGYIFKSESIKEENYPVVTDGVYNENELILLVKYSFDFGSVFFCASGAGDLFLVFEDELWKTKKRLILKNASFVSNSYIRRTPLVFLNDSRGAKFNLYSLNHLRYDSCSFLGLEDYYKELKESNDLFNFLFDKYDDKSMLRYFDFIGTKLYYLYNNYSDTYEFEEIDRFSICVEHLTFIVPFLGSYRFDLDGVCEYFYEDNDIISKMNCHCNVLGREDDLYFDIDKPYYSSKNTLLLSDDKLRFRAVLPSFLSTDTVYYTVCIDFNLMKITHEDIRRYSMDDNHALISGDENYTTYLLNYQILTGENSVNVYEDVDFSKLSKVDNVNKDAGLSVDSLSDELISLGYKKKLRQTTPDYVYMNTFKSAWLNEREFVTLRDYVNGSKKVYQLDLYKDGKYHSSLSGDFKEDSIETLFKDKTSKTNSKSVYNVPKIWLDVYNKNRNNVYYPSYLFFMNYASVYNTSVRSLDSFKLSGNFYTCARFNPTGEFCICYCSTKTINYDSYEIGIEDIESEIEEYKEKNPYYSFISIASCLILMRFKTEEEMFKVYTELFRRRASSCDVPFRLPLLKERLGLNSLRRINDVNLEDYEKELSYYDNPDYHILDKTILKNLGILDISWREIYCNLSDELFNTMIFD